MADTADFKAEQREQWSTVAPGWRRRWGAFERGAQPLSDRMMELAHVTPGQRILDVATGIGEPGGPGRVLEAACRGRCRVQGCRRDDTPCQYLPARRG
jgi:hypothetical protein